MADFVNIFLAIIPTIILCLIVYKMDVVEKEPLKMLFTLFFIGVLITVPVQFLEQIVITNTKIQVTDTLSAFILSFLIIGLIEEGYKFIVLYLGTWKNKNFNQIYDGIVYAVFISLGFATLENIMYVMQNGFETAILRAIISVPAHAFYAISSGYYFGYAKLNNESQNFTKKNVCLILSFLVPIILHGTFDFLIFVDNSSMSWILYGFVSILYILSFIYIKKVSSKNTINNIQLEEGGISNERNFWK